jgi:hypothetical protein
MWHGGGSRCGMFALPGGAVHYGSERELVLRSRVRSGTPFLSPWSSAGPIRPSPVRQPNLGDLAASCTTSHLPTVRHLTVPDGGRFGVEWFGDAVPYGPHVALGWIVHNSANRNMR